MVAVTITVLQPLQKDPFLNNHYKLELEQAIQNITPREGVADGRGGG